MEKETPGILRPTGGSKKFRRNCRLVAEKDAIAVSDRKGQTTRFRLDGTDSAPTQMVSYFGSEPFMVVDRRGRGLITSDDVLWDNDEQAQFCEAAQIDSIVVNEAVPALRPDGVRLEEPAWLRLYVVSAPYVLAVGLVLAPLSRAFDLPVWLMLPFLPWLLMYPVARATGFFTPRRIGPTELRFREEAEEYAEKEARKSRRRKTKTSSVAGGRRGGR